MAGDTAYRHWNSRWATAEGRADWLVPEPLVVEAAALSERPGIGTALDLGCGVGRHAVFLAEQGMAVTALDASEEGLRQTAAALRAAGLSGDTVLSPMTQLPFPAASFDLVVSWNVIYHGHPPEVEQAAGEIRRVLRPGGWFVGTMLSKNNARFGEGDEVAPDTFVISGSDDDKAHAHHYCDEAGLLRLFPRFTCHTLREQEHRKPGSIHWHVIAQSPQS